MLRLYRRHRKTCSQKSERYRRCACPIYVEGTLGGESVRKALDLTSWTAASDLIAGWNGAGEIGGGRIEAPPIVDAVDKFIADARARNVGWEALRKYENLLRRRFLGWCDRKGYRLLKQVGVQELREFRASWSDSPNYAAKNLERLRSFLRFCEDAEWIRKNPARALKSPKVKLKPTLPFTEEEMARTLAACDLYSGNGLRVKAFILVMRHSGLRIGDTIQLSRHQVVSGRIRLYTAKTGQPVDVPVPPCVVEALAAVPKDRYFWSGENLRSAVANWSRYLDRVFKIAGVAGGRSHRFRDTAACSWLAAGLSVEEVATLLGNSPAVVIKHYSPWVLERQRVLEAKVVAMWATAEA
jgi:integrase